MKNKITTKLLSVLMLTAALSLFQPLSAMAGAADGDLEGVKLNQLLDQAEIRCDDDQGLNCTAGPYKVTIHSDCAIAPYYGAVYGQPAELFELADSNQNVTAALAEDQLVCIKATAKTGTSNAAYFIMALPIADNAKCDGVDVLCRLPHPLPEPYRSTMKNCKQNTNGELASCPQGWVKADAIEPHPNGLE